MGILGKFYCRITFNPKFDSRSLRLVCLRPILICKSLTFTVHVSHTSIIIIKNNYCWIWNIKTFRDIKYFVQHSVFSHFILKLLIEQWFWTMVINYVHIFNKQRRFSIRTKYKYDSCKWRYFLKNIFPHV